MRSLFFNIDLIFFYFQDIDLLHIESIIVDISDADSVKHMCERTRLIMNCVGPVGEKLL